MREIIKITIALTVSCLLAGLVIGATFIFTARAKQHNEHLNMQQTMLELLGYGPLHPAPPELRLYQIHHYIIRDGDILSTGYMVPARNGASEGYALVVIDLAGRLLSHYSLDLTADQALSEEDRKKALMRVLTQAESVDFAETIIIGCLGQKRTAYLLTGEFPGFKTFIKALAALSIDFELLGLEVIEHEEDPGLGGEIIQPYFKNQFVGKSFDKIKELKVVKEPLPSEYERYLESMGLEGSGLSAEDLAEIEKNYQNRDIYALTGATISSVAVTNGVKGMVKKFAYRIHILDQAVEAGGVPVLF